MRVWDELSHVCQGVMAEFGKVSEDEMMEGNMKVQVEPDY